jgi:hypothetical protein
MGHVNVRLEEQCSVGSEARTPPRYRLLDFACSAYSRSNGETRPKSYMHRLPEPKQFRV